MVARERERDLPSRSIGGSPDEIDNASLLSRRASFRPGVRATLSLSLSPLALAPAVADLRRAPEQHYLPPGPPIPLLSSSSSWDYNDQVGMAKIEGGYIRIIRRIVCHAEVRKVGINELGKSIGQSTPAVCVRVCGGRRGKC